MAKCVILEGELKDHEFAPCPTLVLKLVNLETGEEYMDYIKLVWMTPRFTFTSLPSDEQTTYCRLRARYASLCEAVGQKRLTLEKLVGKHVEVTVNGKYVNRYDRVTGKGRKTA